MGGGSKLAVGQHRPNDLLFSLFPVGFWIVLDSVFQPIGQNLRFLVNFGGFFDGV